MARRVNYTFTFGATPINVHTHTAVAPSPSSPVDYARKVFIQLMPNSLNPAVVMDGIPLGTVPSTSNDDHITAYLDAAPDATHTGGEYEDFDFVEGGGIDLRYLWVAGTAGDKIKVSVDYKF